MWEWLQAWVTHAAFVFLRLMVSPADTAGSYPRLRWLVSLPNSSLTWKAHLLVLMSPPWRSCPNLGYLICDRAFWASRGFFLVLLLAYLDCVEQATWSADVRR